MEDKRPEDETIENSSEELKEEAVVDEEDLETEAEPEADQKEDQKEASSAEKKTEEKKEKKSFFSKKKDKKDEKIEELTDRLKRSMAEFDNFRKRTDKEKATMFDAGSRNVIDKLLPICDNFERGLAAIPEDQKDSAVAAGMEKIYQQLMKTLTDLGVEAMESVGQPFDPSLHNAIMQEESSEHEENTVIAEFQKGYKLHGTVIRPAMVKVSK